MNSSAFSRLVVVSNRLPLVVQKGNGELKIAPASGGLVTALAPVLKERGGVWAGWPGVVEADDQKIVSLLKNTNEGYEYHPLFLTKEELQLYYHGFANEIIWPLFHDLQGLCNFAPEYWAAYQQVNRKFSESVSKILQPTDFVWIHDYHLMLMAKDLRKDHKNAKFAFFLHTPFPPLDIYMKLPWRFHIIHALLEYDLIGFQTARDRRNFHNCVKAMLSDVDFESYGSFHFYKYSDRKIRVGCFPISIDYNQFANSAASQKVDVEVNRIISGHQAQKIVLSLDRLDYTKGIPYRLYAISNLLERYPNLHGKISLIQIVIPSRTEIPKYKDLKLEIDQLVSEINSMFSKDNWVPIHYFYRSLDKDELLAYYRMSDIALITPVKDGMNLVAKEYVASNIDETGVLILSEFAGASAEFYKEALLVNPYDIVGTADAIHTALNMPSEVRKSHMQKMRRHIRRRNIFWWVESFIKAAYTDEPMDFSFIQDYMPHDEALLDKTISPT